MYKQIDSPVGKLTLIATDKHLTALIWENDKVGRVNIDPGRYSDENIIINNAEKQLAEFFSGIRKTFDLPISLSGTDFQRKVWNALLHIPYGETRTYLQIAKELGNADAVRAVGLANGKNPISIIVPCHRVIGSSGKLVGFAGGVENKALLLQLEKEQTTPTIFKLYNQ